MMRLLMFFATMTRDGLTDFCKDQNCQWLSAAVDFGTFEVVLMHIEAFVRKSLELLLHYLLFGLT
jgi:hypothetical protein